MKGDSLSASAALKYAQNFIRFRFKEFFANYFLPIQGKNEAYTDVLARLLTQYRGKRESKKRGSDNPSMAIHESALNYDTISVSGGMRGLQVILSPVALAEFVDAKFVSLIAD